MFKRILFAILACAIFGMTVMPAVSFADPAGVGDPIGSPGNYEAVPGGHQGYVPDGPSEKIDSDGDDIKSSNMISKLFGKLFNLIAGAVRWVISGDFKGGGVKLEDVIFGKVNPINQKDFDSNNVGHVFSASEWNKAINPLRIAFTFVAWVFFAIMVAWYGIKMMGESTNPLKRSNLQEKLYAWIAGGAMLAFMYMLVFVIFNINYAIVHGLWQLIGGSSGTSTLFDAIGEGAGGLTGSGFVDGLIDIAMAVMTLVLIIQYIFRKFMIAILVIISPMAAMAFAKNSDGMAFKLWISELISQVFIQSAHGLIIVLYLGFVNASVDGGDGLFGYLGSIKNQVVLVLDPVLHFLIAIGGVVAVGVLIWNGLRLGMSGGNPQGRSKALKGIQNGLIGCLVCVGSVMIVNIIRGLMF